MKFDYILKESGLELYRKLFEFEWELSETESANTTHFLSETGIKEYGNIAGLEMDSIQTLIRIGERVLKSPVLSRLFAHLHYLLFISHESPKGIGAGFPDMKNTLGNDGPGFLLLLALSGIPSASMYYKSKGIPWEVAKFSFGDLSIWCRYFERNSGFTGLTPRILNWETGFLRGEIFRLGRLQFTLKKFRGMIHVYRNNRNNDLTVLADNGITFNSEGQIDGVDGFHDKENCWKSVWSCNKQTVTGNPVSPHGFARNENLDLDLLIWDEVLSPGDSVLDTHIPDDGSMSVEACTESFEMALDFFSKYFSESPFKAWDCRSWFLDIQYQKIMPASSNIVKFQQRLFLYPIEAGGNDSYWRVFGVNGIKDGIEKVPRKSSMQKNVAEFIESGGHLRSGGGFLLSDDLQTGFRSSSGSNH